MEVVEGWGRFSFVRSATRLLLGISITLIMIYLVSYEEMVRERYSHTEAGELGDVATEALEEIDRQSDTTATAGDSPSG